jgi:hypothetical protein
VLQRDLPDIAGRLSLQEIIRIRSPRRDQAQVGQIASNITNQRRAQFGCRLAKMHYPISHPYRASPFEK